MFFELIVKSWPALLVGLVWYWFGNKFLEQKLIVDDLVSQDENIKQKFETIGSRINMNDNDITVLKSQVRSISKAITRVTTETGELRRTIASLRKIQADFAGNLKELGKDEQKESK